MTADASCLRPWVALTFHHTKPPSNVAIAEHETIDITELLRSERHPHHSGNSSLLPPGRLNFKGSFPHKLKRDRSVESLTERPHPRPRHQEEPGRPGRPARRSTHWKTRESSCLPRSFKWSYIIAVGSRTLMSTRKSEYRHPRVGATNGLRTSVTGFLLLLLAMVHQVSIKTVYIIEAISFGD